MPRTSSSLPPTGAVLRQLRLEKELTQEELARRAGLAMTYISLVETGKRNPTVAAVARILAVLGVTWTEFGARVDTALEAS